MCLYNNVLLTSWNSSKRPVIQVDQHYLEAAYSQCTYIEGHLIPKPVFESSCKVYSTQHVEVLSSAQKVQVHLNRVSITIIREAHLPDVHKWDSKTHDGIDDPNQKSQIITNYACHNLSHSSQYLSRRSALEILTMITAKIWITEVIFAGGQMRKSRYGDGSTFGCYPVSVFSFSHPWIAGRLKWCWYWCIWPACRWSFLMHWICWTVAVSITEQLCDLVVLMIAYIEWWFDDSLWVPFLTIYSTRCCSRSDPQLKRGIM